MKDGESSEAPTQTGYKRESNLDLAKLMDTKVRVKCSGGREVVGTLRGYDDLVNLVLDDCGEFIRGTNWNCVFYTIGLIELR